MQQTDIQPGPGRPTKRTPATERKILAALKAGSTRKDAAASAGIHYDTFNEWMKEFPEFSVSVEGAEAEIANAAASRIMQEIKKPDGDWRAAESYLKRRRGEEWGDRQKLQHSGRIDRDNTGVWDLSRLNDAELAAFESLMSKILVKPEDIAAISGADGNL